VCDQLFRELSSGPVNRSVLHSVLRLLQLVDVVVAAAGLVSTRLQQATHDPLNFSAVVPGPRNRWSLRTVTLW